MFNQEGYEYYLRAKVSLENKLSETGDFRGSKEVEAQMRFAQGRLLVKIKQAHNHATQEMDALRMILIESTKLEEP